MMRLNCGCGGRYLPDYTNIDIAALPGKQAPDILCDLRKVPLADGCADEIMAIHVFEHFARWEVVDVLKEWHRLLKPGGLLILELPNLIKCCQNIIDIHNGRTVPMGGKDLDQCGLWGCYGDWRDHNPFMLHKWGWSPDSLTKLLHENGFGDSRELETVYHPVGRRYRDMRIDARKT